MITPTQSQLIAFRLKQIICYCRDFPDSNGDPRNVQKIAEEALLSLGWPLPPPYPYIPLEKELEAIGSELAVKYGAPRKETVYYLGSTECTPEEYVAALSGGSEGPGPRCPTEAEWSVIEKRLWDAVMFDYKFERNTFGFELHESFAQFFRPISESNGESKERFGIYIASKTKHAAKWKELRASGVPIISTWIDEAGIGETKSFEDLWRRCIDETASAERLVVYAEDGDELKGGLVEVGAALASGTPVWIVGKVEALKTARNHKLMRQAASLKEAFSGIRRVGASPVEGKP